MNGHLAGAVRGGVEDSLLVCGGDLGVEGEDGPVGGEVVLQQPRHHSLDLRPAWSGRGGRLQATRGGEWGFHNHDTRAKIKQLNTV